MIALSAEPEMRASWYTRFEWPSTDEATCKATVSQAMQALKDANFNTVLFQIRGECDTLYPSPYEPWGPQFNWTDPGWDPTAYAIQEAHARGIKFYAYINTHAIADRVPPTVTVPQHAYNLHCLPGASPNWQIHGLDGQPAGLVSDYIWMSPGVPDAEVWTRQQILYVVETYDIDGLHFDRIRTPAEQYSHDPVSEARFAGEGNPDGLDWGDWMRSQITRQIRHIYGQVNMVKPHVVLTAAPFGICKREPDGFQGPGTESYYSWYQDSFGWMESHVLDAIYPMIYWDIGSAQPYEILLGDFLRHRGGRHIYGGSHVSRDYIAQVYETRSQRAQGNAIFSLNRINWTAYSTGPYLEPAPLPAMEWKITPTLGMIVGYVEDSLGTPLVDARINRPDDSYNYLSAGDGFYTILDVPPGTYTLTASKTDFGTALTTATVGAGQVVRADFVFTSHKGILQLDRPKYRIDETMVISLRDADLEGATTATVEAVSITETTPERVTLTSSESNGRFTGAIPLRSGPPIADGRLQVVPGDRITVIYHDAFDGAGPADVAAHADVSAERVVFEDPFNEDPGWDADEGWAFGAPTGQGGATGFPDPTAGYTGKFVYGYNLDGDYPDNLAPTRYLTTPPVDCSGGYNTRLVFYRWLNVGHNLFDHSTIEVSCDGSIWEPVWENPSDEITDFIWSRQEINISRQADYRQAVRIRWGMGTTDDSVTYSGWNLDDVQVVQLPGASPNFIIDNVDPGFWAVGWWGTSEQGAAYGGTKRFTAPGDGSSAATWSFRCVTAGDYAVDFWINDNNYAEDAHYYVKHDDAPPEGELVIANQNFRGDGWRRLGEFTFSSGTAEITLTNLWTGGGIYVVADALRIRSATELPNQLWMIH